MPNMNVGDEIQCTTMYATGRRRSGAEKIFLRFLSDHYAVVDFYSTRESRPESERFICQMAVPRVKFDVEYELKPKRFEPGKAYRIVHLSGSTTFNAYEVDDHRAYGVLVYPDGFRASANRSNERFADLVLEELGKF